MTKAAAIIGLMIVGIAGCEIEETPPPAAGSVFITLSDTAGNAVSGASIRVDGRETPRYTPAEIKNLSVGTHTISAYKPGYNDTLLSVEIFLNETSAANLVTIPAESGNIDLIGVPDGAVLILNNIPVGTVPVTPDLPTLFQRLGVGTFRATVYLPDHATELPAQWTIQLASGVPVPLTPLFVPVPTAANVGSLAPVFELPCDWDSSVYRLQDYRGQVVFITFFFANCTSCLEEFPYIASIYEDPAFAGKVQFFGVDFVDSYPTFARFRNEHPAINITFPLLRDGLQQVREAYGVSTAPANFVVDATGRLQLNTGGVSEPQLRQILTQLLEQAGGPTFRFSMKDTLIPYDNGDTTYVFHGRVENLLNAHRTFIIELEPVMSPDTGRYFSLCTINGCSAPTTGIIVYHEIYLPQQIDTLLSFDIYNLVSDWSMGFPMPVDSALVGDYLLRATIYPADNASERITHDLHLDDLRDSFFAAHAGRRGRTPFSKNLFLK